jgi:hypothetical protein
VTWARTRLGGMVNLERCEELSVLRIADACSIQAILGNGSIFRILDRTWPTQQEAELAILELVTGEGA